MAGDVRAAMSDLIERLLSRPQAFELFQALHLLERTAAGRAPLGTSVGLDEAVDLRADPSLAFASSDIVELREMPEPQGLRPPYALKASVLGLAGAQGPLPVAFTELLLERQRLRDSSGLDFLDIFNRRALAFLYRSRVKHRPGLQSGSSFGSPVARLIDALSGLGIAEGAVGPGGERPWLRHAAVQAAAPRSMAGVQALLADGLGLKVQGQSLHGAWIELPTHERAVLGRRTGGGHQALRLGLNGSLGLKAWDQAAGVQLTAQPLKRTELESLLPGGPAHQRMAWLLRRQVQSRLRVEVVAPLLSEERRVCRLGITHMVQDGVALQAPQGPRLGLTAWLGGRGSPSSPAGPNRSPLPPSAAQGTHTVPAAQATRFLLRT